MPGIHDEALATDEYDEQADSDFDAGSGDDDEVISSSEDDAETHPKKGSKKAEPTKVADVIGELDSGDEATIKETQRSRKRAQRKGSNAGIGSGDESEGWRAKTRAMRAQDKEERRQKKTLSKGVSTIDVEKLWEEMNKPGPLPPVHMEDHEKETPLERSKTSFAAVGQNQENEPAAGIAEEMITIKRQFKFAGEIHVEEKIVPKTSAEARLWLAQQDNKNDHATLDSSTTQRPVRKVSRFDPNYSNLASFKTNWGRATEDVNFKGPKLNVVEKSKMDWAVHVDTEGLKDELDEHAKAKGGYLSRMDFLNEVEQRKEEEARIARQRG